MLKLMRFRGPGSMKFEAVTSATSFSFDARGTLSDASQPLADWSQEELVTFQGDRLWRAFVDGELYLELAGKRIHCPRGVSLHRVIRDQWTAQIDLDEIAIQTSVDGSTIARLDLREGEPCWRLASGERGETLRLIDALASADALAGVELEESPRLRPSQLAEGQKLVNLSR